MVQTEQRQEPATQSNARWRALGAYENILVLSGDVPLLRTGDDSGSCGTFTWRRMRP